MKLLAIKRIIKSKREMSQWMNRHMWIQIYIYIYCLIESKRIATRTTRRTNIQPLFPVRITEFTIYRLEMTSGDRDDLSLPFRFLKSLQSISGRLSLAAVPHMEGQTRGKVNGVWHSNFGLVIIFVLMMALYMYVCGCKPDVYLGTYFIKMVCLFWVWETTMD